MSDPRIPPYTISLSTYNSSALEANDFLECALLTGTPIGENGTLNALVAQYGWVPLFFVTVEPPPDPTLVPEPATLSLLGVSLIGMGALGRIRRARARQREREPVGRCSQ